MNRHDNGSSCLKVAVYALKLLATMLLTEMLMTVAMAVSNNFAMVEHVAMAAIQRFVVTMAVILLGWL